MADLGFEPVRMRDITLHCDLCRPYLLPPKGISNITHNDYTHPIYILLTNTMNYNFPLSNGSNSRLYNRTGDIIKHLLMTGVGNLGDVTSITEGKMISHKVCKQTNI